MKRQNILWVAAVLTVFGLTAAGAEEHTDSLLNPPETPVAVRAESEFGFLGFIFHTIKSGPDEASADTFDYIKEGGQDILFPFTRLTATADFGDRHHLRFLFQPLTVKTQADLQLAFDIGDETFGPGPVVISYDFPFWRVGYSYDFIAGSRFRMGGGAVLQLRNASIIFESGDGTTVDVGQNLGPVPALKLTSRYDHPAGWFAGFEAVGIFASSAFINGADFAFEGSLLDSSLRAGVKLKHGIEPFLNLRFLGGSARGTSEYAEDTWTSGSAYTENYLAAYSVSLGVTVR
jgi:hypothetical protein